jgi:hypothetical protein
VESASRSAWRSSLICCLTRRLQDLLAGAKKTTLDIQYVSGEETEGVVQGLFKIEPVFIVRMQQVLVP